VPGTTLQGGAFAGGSRDETGHDHKVSITHDIMGGFDDDEAITPINSPKQ